MKKPVYLILSQSGRMLAKAAFDSDFDCVVVDQFGDVDTHRYALDVRTHATFSDQEILQSVAQLWDEYNCCSIILGSGLESRLDLLQILFDKWPVSGNNVATVKLLKDSRSFSNLLKKLDIDHPHTQVERPEANQQRWLAKQRGGCGGEHVSWFTPEQNYSSNCYYQHFLPGKNYSAVFLAGGSLQQHQHRHQLIGCNETWIERDKDRKNYFKFHGAIGLSTGPTWPDFFEKKQVDKVIEKLMSNVALVGLCGIDFIIDDHNKLNLLEVNPRPTATFDLHENAGLDLFSAHLEACQGRLPAVVSSAVSETIVAKKIVYAVADLKVHSMDWPAWVADIPQPGMTIKKGEPVCTVYSEANDIDRARMLVKNQYNSLKTDLFNLNISKDLCC